MATKKTDATQTPAEATDTDITSAAIAPHDNASGVSDPPPATTLEEASGAIIEPAITAAVDLGHAAIDANPRAGNAVADNKIDLNDPARRTPNDMDFAGLGLDPAPYGKSPKK